MKMPNITYRSDLSGIVIADDDYYSGISYYKNLEDFHDYSSYSSFIDQVEKMVRTNPDYKNFTSYLKHTLGINFCQVFSNITESDNVTIEAHHGPIFTLYDISEVILSWFLKNGQRISTFLVADKVLEEHYALRVGIVLLCKTAHEMDHNRDIFLNVNQTIGNVNQFISKYKDYLTDEQKYKIWTYINACKNTDSYDTGILDIENIVKDIKFD